VPCEPPPDAQGGAFIDLALKVVQPHLLTQSYFRVFKRLHLEGRIQRAAVVVLA
jgi:hypothetical protein